MKPKFLHQFLNQDFAEGKQKYGISVADVSDAFDKSADSGWLLQVRHGEIHLKASMLATWCRATGCCNALRHICEEAGYLLVPKPTGAVTRATANALREFGELVEAIADAEDDGAITIAEFERIEREGVEAKAAIDYVVEHARNRAYHKRASTMAEAEETYHA